VELPHGSSELLKFTTSVAHPSWTMIVITMLMRMTIPGHLVKQTKTKTTVSWRLDLLKDKRFRHLSGPR
jgi:hypothetical protein